ncbi:MAG: phosphate signaling complex protein PhoU [Nitrospinae bacterium]|nr:phosphate signaling complex protein PhoU [Nitrospinota bacterium]
MSVTEYEIKHLNGLLSLMANKVEEAINKSIIALLTNDTELTEEIKECEGEINDLDIKIDQQCIKLLALKQPMAQDLRLITTAMKITSELERMADNAFNIAKRTKSMKGEKFPEEHHEDIKKMETMSQSMVAKSVEAFVTKNKEMSLSVIMEDEKVDKINKKICKESFMMMTKNPKAINIALIVSYVSKHMERIADHATNVAEMAIYLIDGKNVRHIQPKDLIKE